LHILFKFLILVLFFSPEKASSQDNKSRANINNFGMQGLVTLPTASSLPDGEMVIYQNNHTSLSQTGFTLQLSPNIGLSFRYSGHGKNGTEAAGRINHDRSFDVDFTLLKEKKFQPAISIGLRDFIGTGWYSSEYIVGTKKIGAFNISGGLGFGRLGGRNPISNPFSIINETFNKREVKDSGLGGTLGNINWFRGPAAPFVGLKYDFNKKTSLILEYSPDHMQREANYLKLKSPINFGISYDLNKYLTLNTQYLHGSTIAVGANIKFNPKQPPNGNVLDKAPLPLRKREVKKKLITKTDIQGIRDTLEADKFIIYNINHSSNHISIELENNKFRSTAEALGKVSRTLQRLSDDNINYAIIIMSSDQNPVASYHLNLEKMTYLHNEIKNFSDFNKIISQQPLSSISNEKINAPKFKSGLNPYFDYKLFDPQQPIRAEIGLKFDLKYKLSRSFEFSSTIKKSILTDFDRNIRVSNSELTHVLSDFPIYDKEGQPGHLHSMKVKHRSKISNNIYSSITIGYLEPMYAGISGELLHKKQKSNFAFGVDVNAVQMRDFNMRFGLRDYKTISSHLNLYYDAGKSFDLEMNIGKYLAKDFGITTKLSRRFGNGWSVGAYATFTDVPFDTFGEGSFDKGFYVNIPVDWIFGKPSKITRSVDIRPITRDGGAMLGSSKTIYNFIRANNQSELKREYGRFLK